jgi:hypothetical protein
MGSWLLNSGSPAGVQVLLQANLFEGEQEAIRLLEQRVFRRVRTTSSYPFETIII